MCNLRNFAWVWYSFDGPIRAVEAVLFGICLNYLPWELPEVCQKASLP
jgi:hypothetical protein